MADLLPGRVALAKYLLAPRVGRAVRRLVPYLEEAAGLHVPPVCVWIAIGLARRRALHVTVGISDARPLIRLGLGDCVAGLTLVHVGGCAILEEAWQLDLWRLVLQGWVGADDAAEVGEGFARVLRLVEAVLGVGARRVEQGAHDHLRRPRLLDAVVLVAVGKASVARDAREGLRANDTGTSHARLLDAPGRLRNLVAFERIEESAVVNILKILLLVLLQDVLIGRLWRLLAELLVGGQCTRLRATLLGDWQRGLPVG